MNCGNYCHCRNKKALTSGRECLPISGICAFRHMCADGWLTSDPTGKIKDLYCNLRGTSTLPAVTVFPLVPTVTVLVGSVLVLVVFIVNQTNLHLQGVNNYWRCASVSLCQ